MALIEARSQAADALAAYVKAIWRVRQERPDGATSIIREAKGQALSALVLFHACLDLAGLDSGAMRQLAEDVQLGLQGPAELDQAVLVIRRQPLS